MIKVTPLIIPVSTEKNTEIPMGMKSAHKLSFHNHNRDEFCKKALTKLVRQYIRFPSPLISFKSSWNKEDWSAFSSADIIIISY
jgi:hypothetical protein